MTGPWITVGALTTIVIGLIGYIVVRWFKDRDIRVTVALKTRVTQLEAALQHADGMLQFRGSLIVQLALKAAGKERAKPIRISKSVVEQSPKWQATTKQRKDGGIDIELEPGE